MSKKKSNKKIYDLLNPETKPKFLCLPFTKQRIFLKKKKILKEKWEWRIEQKTKEGFLKDLATAIKWSLQRQSENTLMN